MSLRHDVSRLRVTLDAPASLLVLERLRDGDFSFIVSPRSVLPAGVHEISVNRLARAPDDRGDHCDWTLLRLGNTELMLNTQYEEMDRPRTPDPARTSTHGDTGLCFGYPDVEAAYQFLPGRGVAVEEPGVQAY